MIELLIAGKRVTLSSDFTLSLVSENPFFTKNGEYSYDIEFSLLDPNNAIIYKHYNRLNNSGEIFTKRSAILIADSKVVINGTEVILNITDTSVKIQIVSGNSELNYLIGGDLKVRSLDLGSAVLETNINQKKSLDYGYPDRNWQILPFANNTNDYLGNAYYYVDFAAGVDDPVYKDTLYYWGVFKPNTGMADSWDVHPLMNKRPQPYLCFAISQILSVLGYTLKRNMIAEHAIYKNTYIVHGYDTRDFAKMLPDWTVTDFFTQVENLFGVTLVVNSFAKSVEILFDHYYLTESDVKSLNVIDTFDCPIDATNKLTHKDVNIGYSLDSENYYKLNKLEDDIKALAIYVDTQLADLVELVTKVDDADRYKKIFHCIDNNTDYIAYNDGLKDIPLRVDSFKNLMNNSDDDETINLELNIIPASFKTMQVQTDMVLSGGARKTYYMQYPVVANFDPFIFQRSDEASDFSINGLAVGTDTVNTTSLSDKMRVAIYSGRKAVDVVGDNGTLSATMEPFPITCVEDLPEYYDAAYYTRNFLDGTTPFRLQWLYDNIWSKTKNINTEKTYTFTFFDTGEIDIKNIFLIKNKEYLCTKIERNISAKGLGVMATGYFYPIT
jgi:hypothetical protein